MTAYFDFTFYTDPGHGWLKVHKTQIPEGLEISPFSYVSEDYFYLEGDCDAPRFLQTLDYQPVIRERHIDNNCFIRRLARYRPPKQKPGSAPNAQLKLF